MSVKRKGDEEEIIFGYGFELGLARMYGRSVWFHFLPHFIFFFFFFIWWILLILLFPPFNLAFGVFVVSVTGKLRLEFYWGEWMWVLKRMNSNYMFIIMIVFILFFSPLYFLLQMKQLVSVFFFYYYFQSGSFHGLWNSLVVDSHSILSHSVSFCLFFHPH